MVSGYRRCRIRTSKASRSPSTQDALGCLTKKPAVNGPARRDANIRPIHPPAEYEFPSFGLPGAVSAGRTRCHTCQHSESCVSFSGWTPISALVRCAPHCGHRSAADHAPQRGHLVCDCFFTTTWWAEDSTTGRNMTKAPHLIIFVVPPAGDSCAS